MDAITLSKEHLSFVHRKRKLIRHLIPFEDFDSCLVHQSDTQLVEQLFEHSASEKIQPDVICWDFADGGCGSALYESELLPPMKLLGGSDMNARIRKTIRRLTEHTRGQSMDLFWNHRVNGPEGNPGALKFECVNEVKRQNPDWTLRNWWWQGFWNYESQGLRSYKVKILQEIAQTYPIDGLQLDFLRDIPVLAPGRQWALKDHVTSFVYDVRTMLLEVAKTRNRPILLAVRIPENMNGCRMDGLDVKTWSRLNLIDLFVLGGRTTTIDFSFFQEITQGKSTKIIGCLEGNHPVSGYYKPPQAYYNAVFYNWLRSGADGIEVYDWGLLPEKDCVQKKLACTEKQRLSDAQIHALCDAADEIALQKRPRTYTLDRKGGYPWATGYGCRNDFATLPDPLSTDATSPNEWIMDIQEGTGAFSGPSVLEILVSGAHEKDMIALEWNSASPKFLHVDRHRKDPQVFPYTPPSNCYELYKQEQNRTFSLYQWQIPNDWVRSGRNLISLHLSNGTKDVKSTIIVEKVEFLRHEPMQR